ncbi:MAG: hypothetical protein MI861_28420 [Pirellulales bacterium]|nr:hypothetical protein [Pirellulales bacterium]
MRNWVLLALTLIPPAIPISADGAAPQGKQDDPEAITWSKAFGLISAAERNRLVVIVITNDDPYLAKAQNNEVHSCQLWCSDVLSYSIRKTLQRRPDLREKMLFQQLAVGTPPRLSGGNPSNQPARAVVAVCDGDYRLLGLTVGVPDTSDLMTLVEDAQEAQFLRQQQGVDRMKLIGQLAKRSRERVSRMWHDVIEEMIVAFSEEPTENAQAAAPNSSQQTGRMVLLAEAFEPVYLADVKLRFSLSSAADRDRLLILEQHPETRRDWSEAMIPFCAGEDFLTLWRPLSETTWGMQPISAEA